MKRILDRFVDWWARRCQHDPENVAADLLEGALCGQQVQYCRRCGGVRFVIDDVIGRREGCWRMPDPVEYP